MNASEVLEEYDDAENASWARSDASSYDHWMMYSMGGEMYVSSEQS